MLIMYSQKLYRAFTVSVSLASTSLLVPAQNALSFVRKYGLEFFQPLAAPQPTKKPKTTSNGYDGAKLWTPRGIGRGDAEAAKLTQTRWRISRDTSDHGDSKTPTAR